MIKNIIAILVFFIGFLGFSQTEEEPVLWTQELNKISDTEFELILKADILKDWHVYSQHTAPGGSLPSEFTFEKAGEDYELVGPTLESETITAFNDIFEVDETYFKEKLTFTQKIKVLNTNVKLLKVLLYYQVCKDVCIPGEQEFIFNLGSEPLQLEEKSIDERSAILSEDLILDLKNKGLLATNESVSLDADSSLLMIFGLGFLGGLIALLTPCVFPMIPLTVSFFTKQSRSKTKGITNAVLYGFFIILIYFLLSLPFHLFDSVDSQILNTIATNIWLNVVFFIIFVFFAFSFFGYYELTLPSSWANKMDSASSQAGGVIGIFFMAVTLAIVSFSCTGPILGGLLGSTALAEGDVATNLSTGMLGFGTALALPFALFALFPAWLNSLPKSGGWMTTVKVVLGFLELALALKFLSNADLVGHWGILKREVFIALWIVIFILLSLYLLGVFRFPHDGPKQKLATIRKIIGVISIAFVLYLVLGLVKVIPLKLLSGFPPPEFYSLVEHENDCPLGVTCFKDFEEGVTYAKKVNKPILLDFTGWACVNCRKMEENVWSDPSIFPIINDEYILISLYVDDRKELPENEQFEFKYETGRVKTIKTIGQKWGTFQTLNFNAASQPFYVVLSPDLEVLNASIQYTDVETYKAWLEKGLVNFRE
ncbi:thioredoxin family protein [Cellulophaga baltica]|uniref:protein-disulfide reductase DsbD family protein n=1 Tax=Cellulophaga TaxID=104264 RepID=UPI001C0761ED|nr:MULTISPECIES: cytochrome c biogenesis protein CcdA [Cellulophaga]MBU2997532.1 thioredoxin family protein [Cellulophaga baltica]MDO6768927.1 cytochrome c biogenesis protein CcdA [Cellulophaga sp. 1_MG-2023]